MSESPELRAACDLVPLLRMSLAAILEMPSYHVEVLLAHFAKPEPSTPPAPSRAMSTRTILDELCD